MKAEQVNALSSAVIALVTVLGLMVGLYYNLRSFRFSLILIMIFEILLFITVVIFTWWIKNKLKRGDTHGKPSIF